MGERLLVTAAVVIAAACEILDVTCRYLRDGFTGRQKFSAAAARRQDYPDAPRIDKP